MQVILNTVTNFGGKPLKTGDIEDVPLNVGMRWISKGIAHEFKVQVNRVWKTEPINEPKSIVIKKAKKK